MRITLVGGLCRHGVGAKRSWVIPRGWEHIVRTPPPWVIDHRSSIVPPDLEHVLPRGWTLARDVPPIVDIPRPGATAGTIHALPPSSIVVSVGIRCGRGPGGLLRDREVETGDGGGAAVSDEERVRGCVGCGCPEEVCLFGRGGGTVLVVLVRVGGRHVR